MNLFNEAKKLAPDDIFSTEEIQEKLGGVTVQTLYNYLKKADMVPRKLADNTPYFTKEDYKKLLFRGKEVIGDGENNKQN